jgi:hypothetical protein
VSIGVACPHCEAKLNVRDDMAGKRGKCPKCGKPIDIPGEKEQGTGDRGQGGTGPAVSMTAEQIAATVREALAALATKPPGNAGTAAVICHLSRGMHYLLPLLCGGALVYHVVMDGSWASGASGTPGAIPYYVLLVVAIALTVMSILSHVGPPRPKAGKGLPLDSKNAPLLNELLAGIAKRLDAPPGNVVAVWDASLGADHGTLRLGASSLGTLQVDQVLGVATRELAVQRNAGRRTARAEYQRLSRLQGEREPGETSSSVAKLVTVVGIFGRPITWPLQVMVRSFAEGELRDAEFDADAIACELVGSRALLTTIQRRRLIDYAAEMTQADLAYQFQDKSLRANRVRMVLDNMQSLPDEVQQSILETQVDDLRTGGYWPTWSERIAAIQKLASPGVLKCNAPAKLLVTDFEGLCKEVTWLDYSQRFGDKVKRKDLR